MNTSTEDQNDHVETPSEGSAKPAPLSFALDVNTRATRDRAAVVVETFLVGRFRNREAIVNWLNDLSEESQVVLPNDYLDLNDLDAYLKQHDDVELKTDLARVKPMILLQFERDFLVFDAWLQKAVGRIRQETDATDKDREMLDKLTFFKDAAHPLLGELVDLSVAEKITNFSVDEDRSAALLISLISGSINSRTIGTGGDMVGDDEAEREAYGLQRQKAIEAVSRSLPLNSLDAPQVAFIGNWLDALEDPNSELDIETAVKHVENLAKRLKLLLARGQAVSASEFSMIAKLDDAIFDRRYPVPEPRVEAPGAITKTPRNVAPVAPKAPSPRRSRVWRTLRALAASLLMAYSGPAQAPDLPEPMVAATVTPNSVGIAQVAPPEALHVSLEKTQAPEKAPTLYDAVRQSVHDNVESVTNQLVEGATDLPVLANIETSQNYTDLIDILESWGPDTVKVGENGEVTTIESYGGYRAIVMGYEAGRTPENCSIQGLIDYAYEMDADGSVGRLLEHNVQMIPRFSQDPLKLKGKVAELIEKSTVTQVETSTSPATIDPTDAPDWNPIFKQSQDVSPQTSGSISTPEVTPTPFMDPYAVPEPVTLLAKLGVNAPATPVMVEEEVEEAPPAPTPVMVEEYIEEAPAVVESPKGWFSKATDRVRGWFR